jgi:hypothetical protein
MPQQVTAAGKKPNQAQIANEQQVDMLTTADTVTGLEGEILTPMLQWMVWLDHQYRAEELLVPSFGELGVQMEMDRIEPIQMDRRFEFRWYGVEAARSVQQMQQQMALLNVIKGIPPEAYPGYQLQLAPFISNAVENTFGSRLGPRIFVDMRKQLSMEPEFENQILESGQPVMVHPMDDDVKHLQAHMAAFQENGDMTGFLREHMIFHQMQLQKKSQAQQMQAQQQPQQGQQQRPQGGGGPPRQGAKPAGPRLNGQQPAGTIHKDQMPMAMPRPRGAA